MSEHTKTPLYKQLLGGLAGAGLALVVYGGYQVSTPVVTAYILPLLQQSEPAAYGEEARSAHRGISQEEYDRLASRSREVMRSINMRFAEQTSPAVMAQVASDDPRMEEQHDYLMETAPNPQVGPLPSQVAMEEENKVAMQEQMDTAVSDNTDSLPRSGIGIWVACLLALGVTTALWKDRIVKKFA